MPFDSQGNFTRLHNWEQDRIDDIDIVTDHHDEEDDNFADLPTPLQIKEKVGNGDDQLTGVNAGFFKATRKLLQIRLQYELFTVVRPNIYFFDNELSVFAYVRDTSSEPLVTIVNLSSKSYAEKQ